VRFDVSLPSQESSDGLGQRSRIIRRNEIAGFPIRDHLVQTAHPGAHHAAAELVGQRNDPALRRVAIGQDHQIGSPEVEMNILVGDEPIAQDEPPAADELAQQRLKALGFFVKLARHHQAHVRIGGGQHPKRLQQHVQSLVGAHEAEEQDESARGIRQTQPGAGVIPVEIGGTGELLVERMVEGNHGLSWACTGECVLVAPAVDNHRVHGPEQPTLEYSAQWDALVGLHVVTDGGQGDPGASPQAIQEHRQRRREQRRPDRHDQGTGH